MKFDWDRIGEVVDEHIGDPFERKQLMRALDQLEAGTEDEEDLQVVLAQAQTLMLGGDEAMTMLLAALGYEPAVAAKLGIA